MTKAFRISIAPVTLLACVFILFSPGRAAADPLLSFLNSDLTFGHVNPDHAGLDWYNFEDFPDLRDLGGTTFQAFAGPLVEHTLDLGHPHGPQSTYVYEGGTFRIDFEFEWRGDVLTGAFVAPIIDLTIVAQNGEGGFAGAHYTLGAGLFDAPIAQALGIRRRTLGGDIYGDLLLTDFGNRPGVAGDHTTPVRQAWDGATDVDLVAVPEPSTLLLGALGAAAFLCRRRARSSADAPTRNPRSMPHARGPQRQ